MSKMEHDWKSLLSDSPHKTRGFSHELARKIQERKTHRPRLSFAWKGWSAGVVVVLCAVLLYVCPGGWGNITHSGASHTGSKPAEVTWNDHIYMLTTDTTTKVIKKVGTATSLDPKANWEVYQLPNIVPEKRVAVTYQDTYYIANVTQFLTLKKAQEQVPFTIIAPKNLPQSMRFAHAMIDIDPNTNRAKGVQIHFESPDHQAVVEVNETKGNQLGKLGGTEKTFTINGHPAKFASNDKISEMLWTDGEIVYHVYASPKQTVGTEQGMTDLAKRFK